MLDKKVMIVDDDEIHQFTTKMLLQKMLNMHNIISYVNPTKAMEYLQENQGNKEMLPDVILLDINMPIMDGFEFLEFMDKTLSARPLVFMVSSSINWQDRERSFKHTQVREYLSKPVNTDEFKEKMNQHLG